MTDLGKAPIQTATLAEIYLKQGFLEKARTVYVGILEDDPTNAEVKQKIQSIDEMLVVEQGGETLSADPQDEEPAVPVSGGSVLDQLNRWLDAIEKRRAHV